LAYSSTPPPCLTGWFSRTAATWTTCAACLTSILIAEAPLEKGNIFGVARALPMISRSLAETAAGRRTFPDGYSKSRSSAAE
jgi:hypothetical protein